MYLSKAILFVSLAASAIASPIRERADLLQVQAYAQFQISDGVAGNALEEVAAKFPVRPLYLVDWHSSYLDRGLTSI